MERIFQDVIESSRASIEKDDLKVLLPLVSQINPKIILEIGAWKGYSAEVWTKAFNPEIFISVENQEEPEVMSEYIIKNNSHLSSCLEDINARLKYKKIDFLFIDGDHSYNGVKMDFEMYCPLVREGGIIVFHDALYHADKTEEVDVFWQEIKTKYPYVEIKVGENSTGIGIIWK